MRDSTSTKDPRRLLGQLRSKHVRLGLFGLLSLALVALLGTASWRWLPGVGVRSQTLRFESTDRSFGDIHNPSAKGEVIPPRLLTSGQLGVENESLGATQRMLVNVLLDETGRVLGTKLDHSDGKSAALENAAIALLLNSKFEPVTRAGEAIAAWIPIEITLGRQGEGGKACASGNSAGAVLSACVMPPTYAGLGKLPVIQHDPQTLALIGRL